MHCQVTFQLNRGSPKTINGIRGSEQGIGTAKLPIPLKEMNIIIDITFQAMRNNFPPHLSMEDMYQTDLYISIQKKGIKSKILERNLPFDNSS